MPARHRYSIACVLYYSCVNNNNVYTIINHSQNTLLLNTTYLTIIISIALLSIYNKLRRSDTGNLFMHNKLLCTKFNKNA